ncbi:hypothetical protein ACTWQF_25410 [Streptomyces sp. 8N114]|uniref:hypothetical protein n=1 Tax=Streptomyces sp. 8N114 TaxID=3457419 RepID=UPI003FD4F2CE
MIAVFLLDHPQVPAGIVATWDTLDMPGIALTRRDWDVLFDQPRSTTAVLDYLFRAAAEPRIPLCDEPVRYYEFAAADAAPPGGIDPELVGLGGTLHSTPLLPLAPVGTAGTRAHMVIRLELEDVTALPLPASASRPIATGSSSNSTACLSVTARSGDNFCWTCSVTSSMSLTTTPSGVFVGT